MSISLLTHLLVLFSVSVLLRLHAPVPQITTVKVLEVRLSPQTPAKTHSVPNQTLLTNKAPTQFKVPQSNNKELTKRIPQLAPPIAENPSAKSDEVGGIAFPGAITTPFQGERRSINSLFHPPPSQQNAAQNYYQQAMEAQARQRAEYQARLIMQQLHQLLLKELDVEPAVSGKCKLIEPTENNNTQLMCDSPALYEVISKNEMNVVGMLVALRQMGNMINGFSAEHPSEKLSITLIND